MGAWIEIAVIVLAFVQVMVAPLVGAWIEIVQDFSLLVYRLGRSPCGSVD